jgi:hypothetical protein
VNPESKKEQVQLRFERARQDQSKEQDRNEKRAQTVWDRMYWAIVPIFLLGTQAAMAQVEIVIDVPDGEAQTILQSYAADELAYAETSWDSSGRIRLARINSAALKQAGVEVQFTPFADVDPIVMVSQGIDGHAWTGERVFNRIDGFDEHGQMADAIKNHPEIKKMGTTVTDDILRRITDVNTVKLGIKQYLKDPNTGDFLLDPNSPDADKYVIDPKTNQRVSISGLEAGYNWLLKKADIADPCKQQRSKAPQLSTEQEARISQQIEDGAVGGFAPDAAPHASCKPSGHVLDRIAALPESAKAKENTRAHNYRRAKPLPDGVRYIETVHGGIVDKSIEPFSEAPAPETHIYRIAPLLRHPEYVMIYETDPSRDHMMFEPPYDEVAFYKTEHGARIKKLHEEKEQHLRKAKANIEVRNETRGDK